MINFDSFPKGTGGFPSITNTIAANQFNQTTNANVIGTITAGTQTTFGATPTVAANGVTNISGTIAANQFNQATNANIIGTITANQNATTATNLAAQPFAAAPNVAGVLAANQFNQATNANIIGTITNRVPTLSQESVSLKPPLPVSDTGNDLAFNPIESTTSVSGPGRRTFNPLAKLISYTYNLSLYMVTPEVYNNFVDSGETSLEGMYVVAESGGTNRSGPGAKALFERDYYIDDLTFKTFVNTKSTDGPTVDSTAFEFKIYEPYGFKFLSELKSAALRVSSQSKLPNGNQASHHMQQIYLLGIKFYGYDSNGTPVKGTGGTDQYTLFPRYFPLTLTGLSFKLDGKATTYTIKAQNTSVQASFGVKRGIIKDQIEIKGKTVEEVLSTGPTDSLMAVLNKFEDNLITGGVNKIPAAELKNQYKIKFIDDGTIRASTVVDDTDNEIKNYKAGTSTQIKTTNESNEKNSIKATASFDRKNRTFSIPAGTTVVQAIDSIIGHSSYVRDAVNKQYKEDPEPELDESSAQGEKKQFKWFNVTPVAKAIGFDKKRQGYVYETTYIINNYKIPYLRSPFINKTTFYPGPHKKYYYIYTGLNTEILSYEQNYNALYYMNSVQQSPPNTYPSVEVNMMTKQNEADSTTFGKAGEAAASIRTSLYSPGDKASAKISILGDPDFLIMTTGMDYSRFPKGYGPDSSVDAHDGQVFIEIKFNEAIDYDNNTGLMTPGTNVEIYKYPPELESVLDGAISYMVVDVVSTFSRGRFTQDLNLILWSPPFTGGPSTASANPVTTTVPSPEKSVTPSIEETNRSILKTITANPVSPVYQGKEPTGMPQLPNPSSIQNVGKTSSTDISSVIAANQFNQRTNASIIGAITSPTNPKPVQAVDDDNSQSSKDMDWIKSRSYF